jgi:hypothetical protein
MVFTKPREINCGGQEGLSNKNNESYIAGGDGSRCRPRIPAPAPARNRAAPTWESSRLFRNHSDREGEKMLAAYKAATKDIFRIRILYEIGARAWPALIKCLHPSATSLHRENIEWHA